MFKTEILTREKKVKIQSCNFPKERLFPFVSELRRLGAFQRWMSITRAENIQGLMYKLSQTLTRPLSRHPNDSSVKLEEQLRRESINDGVA